MLLTTFGLSEDLSMNESREEYLNEEYLQVEQLIKKVKNYNVYILGPSGAGKTTYLPCMYKHLKLPPLQFQLDLVFLSGFVIGKKGRTSEGL